MVDNEASLLEAVDRAIQGGDFRLVDALDKLFLRPDPASATTPIRTSSNLCWPQFNQLVAQLVAFAQDGDTPSVTMTWQDPIFTECRQILHEGLNITQPNPLGYDKAIPLMRIYKQYSNVVSELRLSSNHPLNLVLKNGKNTYTPAEQNALKSAFKTAFFAALEVNEVHTEVLKTLESAFSELDRAEVAYQETLEGLNSAEEMGSLEQLKVSAQLLAKSREEKQGNTKAVGDRLERLTKENRELEDRLRPQKAKLSEVRSSVEYKRSQLNSILSKLDKNLSVAELKHLDEERQRLETQSAANKTRLAALRKELGGINADIKEMQMVVDEGLLPLTRVLHTRLLPQLVELKNTNQVRATQARADYNVVQTSVASAQQSRTEEMREKELDYEEAMAALNKTAAERLALEREINELNAELSRQETSVSSLALQDRCLATTRIIRDKERQFEIVRRDYHALLHKYDQLQADIERDDYTKRNAHALKHALETVSSELSELA